MIDIFNDRILPFPAIACFVWKSFQGQSIKLTDFTIKKSCSTIVAGFAIQIQNGIIQIHIIYASPKIPESIISY